MLKREERAFNGWKYKEINAEENLIREISSELVISKVLFLKGSVKPSDMEVRVPIRNNKNVIKELESNGWFKVGKEKANDKSLIQILRKEIIY